MMTTTNTRRAFLGIGAVSIVAVAISRTTPLSTEGSMGTASPAASPMAMGGVAAAWMVISNTGDVDDRLLSGQSDIAMKTEVHEMKLVGDMMKMSPLFDGLPIPAGQAVELKPGGYHIMLLGLTRDLRPNTTYDLKLTFEEAGEITLSIPVYTSEDAHKTALADATPTSVGAGGIVITNYWSRMAPKLDQGTPSASPEAVD